MATLWTPTDWNEGVAPGISAAQLDRVEAGITSAFDEDTLANRPDPATADRRLFHATDLGAWFSLVDVGGNKVWTPAWHNPAVCDRMTEDFHRSHKDTIDAQGYFGGWRIVMVPTGGSVYVPYPEPQSYFALKTHGSVGGYVNMTTRGSARQIIDSASAANFPLVFETVLRPLDASAVNYHFGIMQAPSLARPSTSTSALLFRVQDGGNVYSVTQNNSGGETAEDMGASPTHTAVDLFRIEVLSASSVVFTFWKGGLAGTKYTKTHTTGIPSVEMLLLAYSVRSNAASTRELWIDSADLLYRRHY